MGQKPASMHTGNSLLPSLLKERTVCRLPIGDGQRAVEMK